MCLIAWNWQPGSETPLLLISNRDEFHARPAEPLHRWPDAPILAGRDIQAGGTWLGVGCGGRLAALTNYRSSVPARKDAPSRGQLVTDFLQSPLDAAAYLRRLQPDASTYNPFNLLVFDGHTLLGLESRGARIVTLQPGIGAVSNADFHIPWPKLRLLSSGLAACVERGEIDDEHLWDLLQSATLAADTELPQTGVPLELERALSAVFITTPSYGTRACSVVRVTTADTRFSELRFDAHGTTGHSTLTLREGKGSSKLST
ncbi:NRDE family protein [Rhodoferax sp.]|uniref:NRDE family protein n=1 Tax=Rhodoferax sp. TaxID=50421 RepID=UPI002ACD63BE|nr:NRDE family protein [Rhodoferax sp.]MDZ7921515.1 NRDE family protein [Rhodoferax sp.]